MRRCQRNGSTWSCFFLATLCLHAICVAAPPAEPGPVDSDLPSVEAEFVQLAEAAKQQFQPVPAERATEAKQQLRQAVEDLEPFLAGAGQENAELWKQYLHWSVLTDELGRTGSPDLSELQMVASRFFQNHVGLELPQYVKVRDALMEWIIAVSLTDEADLESQFRRRLDQLMEWLPQYASEPTVDLATQIGRIIGWLEDAGQAPQLVEAVKNRYRQPNLVAVVSDRLASAGMQQKVEEETDVQDYILGTSISGHATMQGQTSLNFVDNPDAATVQLLLTGNIASNNLGLNRGVRIHSLGSTNVRATKQLTLDADQISAAPAVAQCATSTSIRSITAKSCLIEKLARRRVSRSKGQAEAIASRHAEIKVQASMDQQVEELLAEAREMYQSKFRKPLLRRGQFPERMRYSTLNDYLKLTWCQADDRQLGAPTPPPASDRNSDVGVRVHETFVSNFSRALIGGVTLTDELLVQILKDGTGQVPEELQVGPNTEPWSITFSSMKPVSVEFSEDTIRFAIRGRRFSRGNDVVRQTLELSAMYKLHKTPAGARLVRQGDVQVDYVGSRGRLGSIQIAMRTVMRRKFEALFEQEFNTDGIKMPGRWSNAGKLHLELLNANQGWLALDWTMRDAMVDVAADGQQ